LLGIVRLSADENAATCTYATTSNCGVGRRLTRRHAIPEC
jgi:hypothetical protein